MPHGGTNRRSGSSRGEPRLECRRSSGLPWPQPTPMTVPSPTVPTPGPRTSRRPASSSGGPSSGAYRQLRIISPDGHGRRGGRVLNPVIDASRGGAHRGDDSHRVRPAVLLVHPHQRALRRSCPRDVSGHHTPDALAVVVAAGARCMLGERPFGPEADEGDRHRLRGFSKVFTAGTRVRTRSAMS
jgi:hypothetical protein